MKDRLRVMEQTYFVSGHYNKTGVILRCAERWKHMNYGYYNYYITDIGEDVSAITAELEKYADKIVLESLSSAPKYYELLNQVKEGDAVYVYDIQRSCGGLGDLVDTLKLLVNKGVKFVSIRDDIVVDDSEIGKCTLKTLIVAHTLTGVDPIHGKFR